MSENNNKNGDNKNSFRDMMLIIFVVLICFGITIYGIAYLTSKVFSGSSEEAAPVAEVMPKEVTTNPAEGDTIEFAAVEDETGSNTASERIETKVTKADEAVKPLVEDKQENVLKEEKKLEPAAEVKKQETAKQVKTEPKKEVKKEKAVAEKPKAKEAVKEKPVAKNNEVKRAVEKRKTYVVQIIAVQNKNTANKEAEKYRKKYPDVYVAPVYINGKTLYRVRLGVNEDRDEVQKTADEIQRIYKIKPLVVQNN